MQIAKWEAFRDLDHFFENHISPSLYRPNWDVAVDLYEERGNVIAKISLPGVKEQELDIDIDVEEDILTISGRRQEELETEKKDYYYKEIRRGSFSRSVRLPKVVDAKKSEAEYKKGVLTVTMPVMAGAKNKSVKVEIKK